MKAAKKETRGGARTGAGRPRKEPTRVLGIRVPDSKHVECKELVKIHLKDSDDVRQTLTQERLLDLGFKVNDPNVDASRRFYHYALDSCTLYVKLNGRVVIDADYLTEEALLLEGANLRQVKTLLIALAQ